MPNAGAGTIERWQAGDDFRSVAVFGNSTVMVVSHNNKLYKLIQGSPVPDAAEAALQAVLHPGPSVKDFEGTEPEFRRQPFGKTTLDCVMLSRRMPQNFGLPPLGLFPTYCMTDSGQLAASYNFGGETVLREQLGTFLERKVTIKSSILEGNSLLARAHVLALGTYSPQPDEFEPTAELSAAAFGTQISGAVAAGMKTSGAQPVYPASARQKRLSGTVVLQAMIGTDGRIHKLLPISGPDADLVVSALAAVRTWTYKPYLLNGVPVDITTTITVNYNIRPF